MTDELKQKMLEKVRKLLALATSANEHEASLAAEKAQALLAEYNLSMDEVKLEGEKEDDVGVEVGGVTNRRPWRRPLALAVGKMYFCQYFYQAIGNKQEQHSFVGSKANSQVAGMMFQYLTKTIERLARESAVECAPKEERLRYRISFKNACAQRVTQRIWNRIRDAKAGNIQASNGSNLPALLNMYEKWDNLTNSFISGNIGKMKEKKSVVKAKHFAGAAAGYAAGEKIGLDMQVSGGHSGKYLGNRKQ